jgi:hypothetical protein
MIRLKRLNGDQIVLNADLIELVEATPDTLIHLTTRTFDRSVGWIQPLNRFEVFQG